MKPWCVTIQMKAIEQYFHVVLFITMYKVVLTFQSVDETLVCDYLNESYWAVLSCGAVYALQGSSFLFFGQNPSVLPFKWKLLVRWAIKFWNIPGLAAGLEIATRWSPTRPKIEHWRLNL